jgi:hypothetical protein
MVKPTAREAVSRETVRRRLAEKKLKPWQKDVWCIPKVDGAYVARMEEVLDLHAEDPDLQYPVVCFDEIPTQLIGEVRERIPAAPGRPAASMREFVSSVYTIDHRREETKDARMAFPTMTGVPLAAERRGVDEHPGDSA